MANSSGTIRKQPTTSPDMTSVSRLRERRSETRLASSGWMTARTMAKIATPLIAMAEDRLLFVAYTLRDGRIRIISARGAEPHERRQYHEEIG
jgi:hypothetical protein